MALSEVTMAEPGWRCSLSRNGRGTRSPRCAGAGGSPGRSFYRYRRRYEAEGPEGPRSAVQAAPGVPRADRRPSRGWRSAGFERIIPGGGARGIRAELHRAGVDSPAVSNHPPGPPWKPSGLITRRSGPHQGISDLTPAERCTPSPAPPPADHQELEEPVYPPRGDRSHRVERRGGHLRSPDHRAGPEVARPQGPHRPGREAHPRLLRQTLLRSLAFDPDRRHHPQDRGMEVIATRKQASLKCPVRGVTRLSGTHKRSESMGSRRR